jgi:hypothetical protein
MDGRTKSDQKSSTCHKVTRELKIGCIIFFISISKQTAETEEAECIFYNALCFTLKYDKNKTFVQFFLLKLFV